MLRGVDKNAPTFCEYLKVTIWRSNIRSQWNIKRILKGFTVKAGYYRLTFRWKEDNA